MKKVLLITHLPRASPRIPGLGKYLPEIGWEVILLTGTGGENLNSYSRVIETPYRGVLSFWKKLFRINPNEDIRRQVKKRLGITSKKSLMDYVLTFFGEIVNYPDSDRGWKPFAIKAGSELLQKEDIDAILSSSSPVTSHLIAKELKARYKIPWVADFRDLWSQNHNYSYGPLRRLIDRRLEVKTLSKADALITVSEPWAEELRALHKGKPVYTITLGFDTAEVNTPPAKLTAKFTITYTGSIYTGKHDPSKLFAALNDLISSGTMNPDEIEVRFYGPEEGWLAKEAKEYGLSGIVKQYGMLPRQVALEKQRESQLLLRLKWEDPQERGAYSGKIFEYLAARRPILATGGVEDVVTELLKETKAGISALTVEDIKDALNELYQEYKQSGKVAYKGEGSKVSEHNYRELARKFSEILDHLTQK